MQKVQHFTNKEFSLMDYFYKHKLGHVRQIKNKVRLSEHTLLKYLKELEKKGLLSQKRQGNLKIFQVNSTNQFTAILFSYFDILRLENLEPKRKKAIKEFLLRIKEIKLPYFILLFGSTVKENYTKTSDIDMIIIYDYYEKNMKNKIDILGREIYAETGLKVNFILMLLQEFIEERKNNKNYALQDALETGYPVMGNSLFYEVNTK